MNDSKALWTVNTTKWMLMLVSIVLISSVILFSGCVDEENGDVDEEPNSEATIFLPQETYESTDVIEFEVRNTGDTTLNVGRPFSIDQYNEEANEWENVELDLVWTLELLILEPGQSLEQSFTPEEAFVGEVDTGQYRIVKEVNLADTGESLEIEEEFQITNGTM